MYRLLPRRVGFVVVVVRRRRRRRQHQSPRTVNIKNARFGLIYFATTNSFLENFPAIINAIKGKVE